MRSGKGGEGGWPGPVSWGHNPPPPAGHQAQGARGRSEVCRAATKRHSLISLLPPWPAPAGRPRPLPILQIRRRRHRAATPHAQVSSRWVRESEYEARPLLPPDPVTWLTCAAPRGPAEWGTVRTWGSRRELWSPPAGCASSSGPPSKGLLPLLPKRSWATSAPGPPPPPRLSSLTTTDAFGKP